jgi:hypothetical protein
MKVYYLAYNPENKSVRNYSYENLESYMLLSYFTVV